jgi:hypothetical protein
MKRPGTENGMQVKKRMRPPCPKEKKRLVSEPLSAEAVMQRQNARRHVEWGGISEKGWEAFEDKAMENILQKAQLSQQVCAKRDKERLCLSGQKRILFFVLDERTLHRKGSDASSLG